MMFRKLICAALFWGLMASGAFAHTLILVQGYLGNGTSWREEGVTQTLRANGWSDGGHLMITPRGVQARGPRNLPPDKFVTIELPTEAPVHVQADIFARYMDYLKAVWPDEKISIAGHSAGGIVARFYMVRTKKPGIHALITIASPHLGTDAAETGLAVSGLLAPFIGGSKFDRSQGLYSDLIRERPGSMLGWLNRQKHPKAAYISVIREDDAIVPEWSQDMRLVADLRSRAKAHISPLGHKLQAADGNLIAKILRDLAAGIRT